MGHPHQSLFSSGEKGGDSIPIIYRKWITLRNGRRLYASSVGKDAFRFWVDQVQPKKKNQ